MLRGKIGAGRLQGGLRKPRTRRAAVFLIATSSAVVSLGASAIEPASAGTYVMRSCDVPGYSHAPLGPWETSSYTPEPMPMMVIVDACAAGGGVGFRFAGSHAMTPGSAWARLVIARPPTGPQSEIRLVSVSMWYAARLGGSGQDIGLFASDDDSDKALTNPWLVTGRPGAENLSFERTFSRTNVDGFSIGMYCGPVQGPIPPDPCAADDTTPLHVRGMEVRLSEDKPPTVLQPAGTLLGRGPQSGVRTLSYTASDLHSGLARVDVLLDDKIVKTHDLTPRCSYSDFTVCPTSDDETLEIDTRLVPNGFYDLALRVRDAAGNAQVEHGQRAIEVANQGSPASASATPYTIVANFKGSSRSTLTVPYGRRVAVRGRVTQGSQPMRGHPASRFSSGWIAEERVRGRRGQC